MSVLIYLGHAVELNNDYDTGKFQMVYDEWFWPTLNTNTFPAISGGEQERVYLWT